MNRTITTVALVATFAVGLALGTAVAGKSVDTSLFVGAEPAAAGQALLQVAADQAGSGSWERLVVARVHLLAGDGERARAIFAAVTSDDPEPSDWLRIGGIWAEAGNWGEAKAAFDKALAKKAGNADYLAEIGAYTNLAGDRAAAEELFRQSFAEDADDPYSTAMIAGSYLGVTPRRW